MLFSAPTRWFHNWSSKFNLERIWRNRVDGVLLHSGRLYSPFMRRRSGFEGRLSPFPPLVHRCSQREGQVRKPGGLSLILPDGPPKNRTTDVPPARRRIGLFGGHQIRAVALSLRPWPPLLQLRPRSNPTTPARHRESRVASGYQNSHESP